MSTFEIGLIFCVAALSTIVFFRYGLFFDWGIKRKTGCKWLDDELNFLLSFLIFRVIPLLLIGLIIIRHQI